MSTTGPLGILGGTFDPPHLGHLVLAECARAQFSLEQVLFVPAGDPYHRRSSSGFHLASPRPDLSPSIHRIEMTGLAVAGNDAFAVDERELRRPGPSYTVDTLEELTAELAARGSEHGPKLSLLLLAGADSLAEMHRWKDPDRIGVLATVAAAPRGDVDFDPDKLPFPVLWIDMPRLDVTSTFIRERVAAGRSIRYLVPEAVAEYIRVNQLYREG